MWMMLKSLQISSLLAAAFVFLSTRKGFDKLMSTFPWWCIKYLHFTSCYSKCTISRSVISKMVFTIILSRNDYQKMMKFTAQAHLFQLLISQFANLQHSQHIDGYQLILLLKQWNHHHGRYPLQSPKSPHQSVDMFHLH